MESGFVWNLGAGADQGKLRSDLGQRSGSAGAPMDDYTSLMALRLDGAVMSWDSSCRSDVFCPDLIQRWAQNRLTIDRLWIAPETAARCLVLAIDGSVTAAVPALGRNAGRSGEPLDAEPPAAGGAGSRTTLADACRTRIDHAAAQIWIGYAS
ncbi:hypothetical protein ACLOJK_014954 [Asimina triloba]